jgi:hypothetical protein
VVEDVEHLAAGYREFAAREGRRSPLYAELAAGVAADAEVLGWLSGLPQGKRQPNLVFAAARLVAGTPSDWPELRGVLATRRAEVEREVLARRTQTNEPARCALLLPALAALPQPLALLEVGASAGLCLLPDRYAYAYGGRRIEPSVPVTPDPPLFRCRAGEGVPLPQRNVDVAWRAGLELHPLDLGLIPEGLCEGGLNLLIGRPCAIRSGGR